MTIDYIEINFYDDEEGQNYKASLSALTGEDYPDNLDSNEYAQQVLAIIRKALDLKDQNCS
jgi:hypothetical protein